MKTINEIIDEERIEHSINTKLTSSELLMIICMIDSMQLENANHLRNKLVSSLRPNITKLLRSYSEINNKYDYHTIFNTKNKEDATELLKILTNNKK